MRLLLFFTSSIFISSCAFHSGSISSNSASEAYYYHDIALGFSETKQFLMIGGNSKDALILEAKKNLSANRPLKKGERYTNYVVDFKVKYIFGMRHLECTVSADVVSLAMAESEELFSEVYKRKTASFTDDSGLYNVGDIVHVGEKQFVIVGFKSKKKLKLAYEQNFKTRYMNFRRARVISEIDSYSGYQLGEIISIDREEYIVTGFTENKIESKNRMGTRFKNAYSQVVKVQ